MSNDIPLSGFLQSALTILLVFIITPLFTGYAIHLAVDMGDEVMNQETPQDTNGFRLYNSNCPQPNYPSNQQYSSSTNPTYSQSSTQNISPSSTIPNQLYTRIQYQVPSDITCNTSQGKPDTIILPPNMFEFESQHTSFVFELFTGSTLSSGNWWTYLVDIDFRVNNVSFAFFDDFEFGGQTGPTKSMLRLEHTFTIVEYNDLVQEQNECENTCEFTIVFSDLTTFQCPSNYCGAGFMTTTQFIKFETKSADAIETDLVLTVAPVILGAAYLLIALASTPLWNPIFVAAKRRVNNA